MPGHKRDSYIFLNVADGKFRRTIKSKVEGQPDVKEYYDGWSGLMTDIKREEQTYKDRKFWAYKVYMQDENGIAIIQFSEDAKFYSGFFARITQIDLEKEFMIGVLPLKWNEKSSLCYMQQGIDKETKKPITIKKTENWPEPEKKLVGKKKQEVIDWELVNDRTEEIMKELTIKLKEIRTKKGLKGEDDLPF